MTGVSGAAIHPRDFRLLAAGQALSWLGNGFQTVALAVAVVLNGGGPGALGLVLASSIVGRLAGALFGGVWADRVQPQLVMVLSDLVRLLAVAGMAVMFAVSSGSVPLLCALAAVTAVAGAFFSPAMTALKPMVVTVEARRQANATLSLLQWTCQVLGPAAGGLTVAAVGAATGFAVNAGSFLASILSVLFIKARVERTARSGLFREMGEGWSAIREREWLLRGVLAATAYHVANGVVLVLAQVLAVRNLGGASAVGVIAAAEGMGGVVGAAVGLRLRPRRLLRAGWPSLLLMPLWAFAYVWPGTLAAVVVGAVIGYTGLIFYDVQWTTAIQDHVPHHVIARVDSWDMLTSFLAMPVGNALAGPLAHAFGTSWVLSGCSVVLLLSGASPLLSRETRQLTRRTGAEDDDARAARPVPELPDRDDPAVTGEPAAPG
ncbi:MAG: MFS transporter [Actinomycetales bacterium]